MATRMSFMQLQVANLTGISCITTKFRASFNAKMDTYLSDTKKSKYSILFACRNNRRLSYTRMTTQDPSIVSGCQANAKNWSCLS